MSKIFIKAALLALIAGCATTGPGAGDADPGFARTNSASPLALEATVRAQSQKTFSEGTLALREGRLQAAEALLRAVTEDQPELAGPWINLSQALAAQGRVDEARAALEAAVRANPQNCHARTELALALRRQGLLTEAEQHYLACLAGQPDYQPAYLNLGILYELYLGRLPEALEAYRRYQALAAQPDGRVAGWVQDIERRLGV